jgi:hypothetical protein
MSEEDLLLLQGGVVCPFSTQDDPLSAEIVGPVLDEPKAESSGEKLHFIIFPEMVTSS